MYNVRRCEPGLGCIFSRSLEYRIDIVLTENIEEEIFQIYYFTSSNKRERVIVFTFQAK